MSDAPTAGYHLSVNGTDHEVVEGWLGESLQLFNVLALILLLGIGVDYGIFLLEHDGDGSAWLAVVLGAASTLLSFGLLGLSGTPALRAWSCWTCTTA